MYTAEDIREMHDIPSAEVREYGDITEVEGLLIASFVCKDGVEEFIVIASENEPGNTTTSRYEQDDVIKAGEGDFHKGVVSTIKRHAYEHLEDLIQPE